MNPSPKAIFRGVCLLLSGIIFLDWMRVEEPFGFLIFLFLIVMYLLRYRIKRIEFTIYIELFIYLVLFLFLNVSMMSKVVHILVFQGFFYKKYLVILLVLPIYLTEGFFAVILTLGLGLLAYVLSCWDLERTQKQSQRDQNTKKYNELDTLRQELTMALKNVEAMTAVAERTRIAHDIHDNAGHEIIASFITLQTVRSLLDDEDSEMLELYDQGLVRLNIGVQKMRDSVHNLSAVTLLGVTRLKDICERFPVCVIDFKSFGDTTNVSINHWNILETCLNESLTNIMKHSQATKVLVELDVTPYLIRMYIQNDGVSKRTAPMGSGLRSIRYRLESIGGSLSIQVEKTFNVICIIPIS